MLMLKKIQTNMPRIRSLLQILIMISLSNGQKKNCANRKTRMKTLFDEAPDNKHYIMVKIAKI